MKKLDNQVKSVLFALKCYSDVRPTTSPFSYNPFKDVLLEGVSNCEICTILDKFEKDFKIIKIVALPDVFFTDDPEEFDRENEPGDLYTIGNFDIQILSSFNKFAEENLDDDNDFKLSKEELLNMEKWEKERQKTYKNPQNAFSIEYTKNREVMLNGLFLLSKPDFNSENDLVFSFSIANPNKIHTKKDIELAIQNKIIKSFHKIVENLGFTNELKTLFFNVSKDAVFFRNPVTKNDLIQLNIDYIKISR